MLELPWADQNATLGSQIGYGWLQSSPDFSFVFAAKLYHNYGANELGVSPSPHALQDGEIAGAGEG